MSGKLTLGVDEAGRGPAIGPMVLSAVSLDTLAARRLSRMGLRDSKVYGAGPAATARRREMADSVRKCASFFTVVVVDVSEVDRRVQRHELNTLEQEVAASMIRRAPCVDRIVCDGKRLFGRLAVEFPHLDALDRAESKHAAVAAASVLAKHRRDEIFRRIAARYEPLFGEMRGGGYVNAQTRLFLRAYAERFGTLPPEARRSWPYPYLSDILGEDYDPFSDCPDERLGQLPLC